MIAAAAKYRVLSRHVARPHPSRLALPVTCQWHVTPQRERQDSVIFMTGVIFYLYRLRLGFDNLAFPSGEGGARRASDEVSPTFVENLTHRFAVPPPQREGQGFGNF